MKATYNTITFNNIKFDDACELMGGFVEGEGDIKICEIRKGLESYLMIEKKDSNIEIISRSQRELTVIDRLNRVMEISCNVNTIRQAGSTTEKPSFTVCEFYSEPNETSIVIEVRPWSSITVHRYPVWIINGTKVYSTIGKTKEKRLPIHINFRETFENIYESQVTKSLRKLLKRNYSYVTNR